jgi:hypothetical protein
MADVPGSPCEDGEYENESSCDDGERSGTDRAFPIMTVPHAVLPEVSAENAAVWAMVPGNGIRWPAAQPAFLWLCLRRHEASLRDEASQGYSLLLGLHIL